MLGSPLTETDDLNMHRIPTVKAVMTPFPYSVDVEASVDEAQAFMREHNIHHLPVTDKGDLAGVISDGDIKLLLGPDFAFPDATELKVHQAMIAKVYTADLNARLDKVLDYMAEHHLGCAVITKGNKLVGVFTATDACRSYAEFLRRDLRRSGGNEAA